MKAGTRDVDTVPRALSTTILEQKGPIVGIPHPSNYRFKNLVGHPPFERLEVIEFAGINKHNKSLWLCRCACGNTCTVLGNGLLSKKTKSCGCLKKEGRKPIHGQGREGKRTFEYQCWKGMKSRCLNPNEKHYPNYGGRGIKVCDRWLHSFPNFFADMGPAPSPEHTLDRKESNGNYEPDNCRWATWTEQQNNRRNNRRIQWQGENLTVQQWSRKLGINPSTIYARLNAGKPTAVVLGKST